MSTAEHRAEDPQFLTRKGRERRSSLLSALEELLGERPLDAVEIEDIARRAGISRSGFYFYFPTKQAAVAALVSEVFVDIFAANAEWFERTDIQPHERVRGTIEATFAYWREHAGLMVAIQEAAATDREARHVWDTVMDEARRRSTRQIAADQAAGLVSPECNPAMLSFLLTGMVQKGLEADGRAVATTGSGIAGLEETLVWLWVRALYANPAPKRPTRRGT
jgi:TetR/AcrR family transcriptional regulator, ethionamide resistance regulator